MGAFVRGLLPLVGLGIVGLVIAFVASGDRAWLRYAVRLLVGALIVGVAFFAVLFVQQLL